MVDQTHTYDGTLGTIYRQIHEVPQMTFEHALHQIEAWLEQSLIKDKQHIYRAIHLIRFDPRGNYDSTNQIHVEELLPRVVANVKDFEPSGIDLFLHNLGEISELGSCAQGRTTRLLGFYIPYRVYI